MQSYRAVDFATATTEKISVTLGRAELRGAKRLASELGLSLSTVVNDAVKRRLVVVAKWWRAGLREKERARILRSVIVEPVSDAIARRAGAALTVVPGAQTIDAIVMASASLRAQEVVYTSDPSVLERLRERVDEFRAVRIEKA